MFDKANFVGGSGRTGSTPDCIVAMFGSPGPFDVQASTSNI